MNKIKIKKKKKVDYQTSLLSSSICLLSFSIENDLYKYKSHHALPVQVASFGIKSELPILPRGPASPAPHPV
jgi:hypothetical protein